MKHTERLTEKIRTLPDSAGVYQFFDKFGKLLYIGKAKSLKKRVKSYFKFKDGDIFPNTNPGSRIYKMVSETVNLQYIVVESEHDALILENSLIKQLKPKYNILLRDDKTYPYIFIDMNKKFPRFEITREVVKGKGIKYFGPFSTGAKEIYSSIYDIFPLVQKKGCLKSKKACLFYQIKKCTAPCEDKISENDYISIVNSVIDTINNKNLLINFLKDKMSEYSDKEMYEEAAKLRDKIDKIDKSLILSSVDLAKKEDIDIFAIDISKTRACVVRMFVRDGKIVSGSHSYFRSDCGFDIDELYRRSLLEFYTNTFVVPAQRVLVYQDFADRGLIELLLGKEFGKKAYINVPKI